MSDFSMVVGYDLKHCHQDAASVFSRFTHILSENKLYQQKMFYYVQASMRQMIHTNDLSLNPYMGIGGV